ncbi:MAG TPA: hypothetical protein VGF48_13720 [Thermoanaerobaculia bacterium]|jgi:hypothetical protein
MERDQPHHDTPGETGCRWVIAIGLFIAGAGCIFATYALIDLGETWASKAVALLVTEPIALACLLGAAAMIAPQWLPVRWFERALRRASRVVFVLIFLFVTGVVGMFCWALWGYLSSR